MAEGWREVKDMAAAGQQQVAAGDRCKRPLAQHKERWLMQRASHLTCHPILEKARSAVNHCRWAVLQRHTATSSLWRTAPPLLSCRHFLQRR